MRGGLPRTVSEAGTCGTRFGSSGPADLELAVPNLPCLSTLSLSLFELFSGIIAKTPPGAFKTVDVAVQRLDRPGTSPMIPPDHPRGRRVGVTRVAGHA